MFDVPDVMLLLGCHFPPSTVVIASVEQHSETASGCAVSPTGPADVVADSSSRGVLDDAKALRRTALQGIYYFVWSQ